MERRCAPPSVPRGAASLPEFCEINASSEACDYVGLVASLLLLMLRFFQLLPDFGFFVANIT